nr:polyprenyl synthetase family protein [Muribaculaceae bacterium]
MFSTDIFADMVEQKLPTLTEARTPATLFAPIAYTLSGGGKRLRPVLLLAAAKAFGLEPAEALDQALGIEVFHNFTLLHDDVMDNADVRRGRPAVHRRWNASAAILSGDAMLTMATQLMTKAPAAMLPEVMELFNTTAMEVYAGQQLDMDFEERQDVTVDEYIEMIRLKTSVLLACACRMGALLAGASEESQTAMYRYGELLGLAFQLQDDLLDTYGDPALFGKEIGGDIINEKKTWLWINAMAREPQRMRQILDKKLTDYLKIREITEVYD